ncbi:callose synthase 9 [Citrus sinensis]|uniref:Callose synthase 9 n=1 Tax=Citrus sinensis TaxID=2711 RepID=A0ACB8MUX3_CITSI|nr:callose synthase 9 [Citrus sinensis]
MSRVEDLWERLVRAALRRERTGKDALGQPVSGIAGYVPSSLANNRDIDAILRAADEIQEEDPSVSRILCEHAYSLAQNLDPNSEGRGVLQFKTGLMSVIKEFYKRYREKNNVDKLREEEMLLRESGVFSGHLGELERKTVKRKRVFATLKVLGMVLEQLTQEIPEELKQVIDSDAAMTDDLVAYNIVPLDAPTVANAIVSFPEVQAAVSALKYFGDLPRLPEDFPIPPSRNIDMLDFLHFVFGFQCHSIESSNGRRARWEEGRGRRDEFYGSQKDNVSNQREHIVLLLANEQSRLGIPDENEPKLDEAAVQRVFMKSLDNYIKWCDYLCIQPVWSSLEAVGKEKKILFVSLYLLIWGEAANIRFLPECLCYIFHHMAREMDVILGQQTAQPANSCTSENGVSFLDQVITPLYEVVAANLLNPGGGKRRGKTSFVEHRSFLHLYHSFHRLWIFLVMMFQGLAIIGFNDENINSKKFLREVLSLGPTYVVMKFFESRKGVQEDSKPNARSIIFRYMLFWLVILSGKFSFAYFLQIKPLVKPTRYIVDMDAVEYSWHDFVSRNNHHALAVASLWAPVIAIYLLDIYIFYTLMSAAYGFLLGARDRLGEIRSVEAVHALFEEFPRAFMDTLHVPLPDRTSHPSSGQAVEKKKFDAARFSPFWNEIIKNLREEDYITNLEMELLLMPKNSGSLLLVQWPLFLLASKIFYAKDIAVENRDSQDELWERISRDEYMKYAVEEFYHTLKFILTETLEAEGRMWVERIYDDINVSVEKRSIHVDFQLTKLPLVISRVTALMGVLKEAETPVLQKGAVQAVQDLYDVVRHDVLSINMRENYDTWNLLSKARTEGRLFSKLKWPKDAELKAQVKRLHSLLTIKDSASNIPRNLEARRRLEFFTNSLFMDMPPAKPAREMLSFCVFTPYYSEIVLYSMDELLKKNEDGISILFYLQKIYPVKTLRPSQLSLLHEWKNFLSRIGRDENSQDTELFDSPSDILELRFWASYRAQTLARTDTEAALSSLDASDTQGFELSREARAHADLKFTYVVTSQIYGKQKEDQKPEAADIALLMQRNEALRVAFIDDVETLKDGKVHREFYSKLVKGDINGKDKDNYFEEALKMRNLLEEFHADHGIRPPTILGVREHVFTGSVSSLAYFMSNQETSFVTLGQRVLANPLKCRMHYGHPDVFDRVFHITRGGISKASRVINISEDIYAGFNTTLRQGNVTHHEYIQVGKGRDVGLNQIAVFEGKVAGGNGEQVLSRDVYRLGQLFDFFRMMSFYFTTVGYYFCTMLTVLTVYAFLYGKTYLALSGVGEELQVRAQVTENTALTAALNTQFLFQIGIFTAVPMVLGFILEQGFLAAVVNFITMQLQLCSVFFTFSLGTRTHYFGRTILHGGARYQATGRGLEVVLLLIVYIAYGYNEGGTLGYILLSISSWFMALSWLFAPYLFNPSGFEWQKVVEDFRDWTNWLFYRGGIGVKGEESWEAWWDEELSHIRTFSGRIAETILSLRFFIFQYGIVYKLNIQGSDTSLTVYGLSWVVFAVLILLFKVFTFSQKISVNFQLLLRFIQGLSLLVALAGLSVAVAITKLSIPDVFACILAFVPTGWGILCIASAWKPLMKKLGLWKSVRSIARLYDAGMGMLIFIPIAMFSWFPFISTFQTRLMFNQAFSRGLEISLILAGNNPNTEM